MRVIGIDPGTINLGYGVVDAGDEVLAVDFGVLTSSPRIPREQRLRSLYDGLNEVIDRCQPDEMAIEEPFMGKNARSAFAIGMAQALASLAGVIHGLPIYHYSPTQVKQQVTGYGRSDKQQVQKLVKMQLGLAQAPQSSDAADALAVAICHAQQSRFNRWVADRS